MIAEGLDMREQTLYRWVDRIEGAPIGVADRPSATALRRRVLCGTSPVKRSETGRKALASLSRRRGRNYRRLTEMDAPNSVKP